MLDFLRRLFSRKPRYHESAYSPLYSAVVARLARQGVTVGGTAALPRIEVHTITEGERMDKDGSVRQLSLTVECVSNRSFEDAVAMNDTNLRLLTENDLEPGKGWTCLGVIPTQLQDLTETADTQAIIYRLLQQFNIFIAREEVAQETTGEELAQTENPTTENTNP